MSEEIWTGSKSQKATLRAKYGGRCAYCGAVLDKMHADHLRPVIRVTKDPFGKRLPAADCRLIRPELNTVKNMMPACAPCNLHKGGYSLEEWRTLIARAGDVLAREKSIYRAAVRFGVVAQTENPVVFFFERAIGEGEA